MQKGWCTIPIILVIITTIAPTSLWAQQNTERFQEVTFRPVQVIESFADWGDYNNDGNLDLVVTGRINPDVKEMRIYENQGDGTFTDINADIEGVSEGSVKWADFDGDGDLDLAAVGWDGLEQPTATIYENEGAGTFIPINANLQGVTYGSADWADYNDDGNPDLVITGADDGLTPTTTIYRNEGDGTFTPIDANLMGVWKGSADWADVDGDGDPDLVITGRDREDFPISVIYENEGEDSFSQLGADLMGVYGNSSSHFGDYDNDGDPDLLISGWNANIEPATVIYENLDNGDFESTDDRLVGINDGMAQWIDYNNDDRLDIMISGANAELAAVTRIYRNDTDTSFVMTDIDLKGTWKSGFSWGDFNNDGLPDLVLTGADFYNKRATVIYENVMDLEDSQPGSLGNE